jgi:uncharacterized protein
LDGQDVWVVLGLGLGLALVLEGLLPFLSPTKWRQMFAQIQKLQDGQIRFFGLISIGIGLLIILALLA